VSLFEFNEQLYWERFEKNVMERGMQKGIAKGNFISRTSLLRKKISKGLTVDEIADILDVEAEVIQDIFDELSADMSISDDELFERFGEKFQPE